MNDDLVPPALGLPEGATADDDADVMRAELLRLRRDLDQVQNEFNDTHAAQLLEANEKLVLAVVRAERIAEEAKAEVSELTQVTQHDALTDTPNRALMMDRLHHAIAMAKRHESRVALLFVDIDRFKHINDSFGHAVGDELLQLVARNLQAAVRDSDTVSRHSGDEFLVLLADVSQPADAALIAQKMLAAVAASRDAMAQPLAVSASIGIAIYPDDGEDAADLIGKADAAMYLAKRRGGAGFEFHGAGPSTRPGLQKVVDEPDQRHFHDLRAANEQLVLSSIALHESQARAARAHQRQVARMTRVIDDLLDGG